MDLSNRYPSKYYESKSQFTSFFIIVGIIVLVLLGIFWLFTWGLDKVANTLDGNEHSRLLSVWMNKTQIKYTKIHCEGFTRTINESDGENEYVFKVKGYQDSSMTAPDDSVIVKATFIENFSRQPKYMTTFIVRRNHDS